MRDVDLRRATAEIVKELFTNGTGEEAERLVLFQDTTSRDLGGLCPGAVSDRIIAILRKRLLPKAK